MTYDFDTIIDRSNTGSEKWDRYSDPNVLPMWVADMDFAAAPEILSALRARIDHGILGYTLPTADLREPIITYLAEHYDWHIDPSWLVWMPGLQTGLNAACRAAADNGETVMTPTPIYPPFLTAPRFSARNRINVALKRGPERWEIDIAGLEAAVTPETRLLLWCSPHNPVGRAWTREELAEIISFCERHDLILCSDEIHCGLVLDDVKHISAGTLPGAAERTITMMAPSKTWNLPGLNCGFAVIPNQDLKRRFIRTMRGIVPSGNVMGYIGCAAAYSHGEPWRRELIQYLRGNRDYLQQFVAEHMPSITTTHVEATYLAWFDVRQTGLENPCQAFEEGGVGLTDGGPFRGPGHVRLNFGCPRATLEEGLRRMAEVLRKHN
jgi:cystathionine beta-lyase